uniref:ELMO domain-containing protein n=1 Tax=Gongylonema pulchrum TaxID=637853 RepID=A0A183DY12_9BILA
LRKGNQLDVGIEQQLVTVQRIQLNELSQKAMRIPTEAEIERFSQLKVFNGESSKAEEKRAEFLSFREAVVKTPPGSLALETILSFGTRHADTIAKISLENSMRSDHKPWSFTVVSAHLVQMLIDILHIINEPGILSFFFALEQRSLSTMEAHFFTEGERLMVLLFKSDRPFLDLFAVLVRLFHRTWREMHASDEDIKKVLAVVRKQMDVCLLEKPESIEKLEELLAVHSYPHMKKLWEDERSAKEAEELQSDAVKLSFLILLAQQFWFWKLDANEKTLICSDCANSEVSSNASSAANLKRVDKLSVQAQRQVDRFLNIELKMRLLELDHIPNTIEIPPLPANFDWIPRDVDHSKTSITKV